ncbi:MAG: 50S ribosomal protein L31e [Nanoarchaeota archaeon]
MPELERVYNIPLRKGYRKAPKYMRANKAIIVIREFLQRHMKSQNVKLGPYLNSEVLKHGRKNVPHHVEVKVIKEKEVVKAELASAKDLSFLEFEKKEEKKGLLSKLAGKKDKIEVSETEKVKEEKVEKKEDFEKEKIKIETDKKEVEKLAKDIMKGKLRGKEFDEKEAVKSPRKSLEAETYGRPSKKIQHKKPKKE